MDIYFASNNEHKREEMASLFPLHNIVLPKDIGLEFSVEEDGTSFIENSLIKAKALYNLIKKPVLADDSGLLVEALPNELGIYTARFGQSDEIKLTSKEQYELLLKRLDSTDNRKAKFVCALSLILDENNIVIIEENMEGSIARNAYGLGGFGYDPVFINSKGKTNAELTRDEKNTISHRAKAAIKINNILEKI